MISSRNVVFTWSSGFSFTSSVSLVIQIAVTKSTKTWVMYTRHRERAQHEHEEQDVQICASVLLRVKDHIASHIYVWYIVCLVYGYGFCHMWFYLYLFVTFNSNNTCKLYKMCATKCVCLFVYFALLFLDDIFIFDTFHNNIRKLLHLHLLKLTN